MKSACLVLVVVALGLVGLAACDSETAESSPDVSVGGKAQDLGTPLSGSETRVALEGLCPSICKQVEQCWPGGIPRARCQKLCEVNVVYPTEGGGGTGGGGGDEQVRDPFELSMSTGGPAAYLSQLQQTKCEDLVRMLPVPCGVEQSLEIRASPEEVFSVINDLSTAPFWALEQHGEYAGRSFDFDGSRKGPGARILWVESSGALASRRIVRSEPGQGVWYVDVLPWMDLQGEPRAITLSEEGEFTRVTATLRPFMDHWPKCAVCRAMDGICHVHSDEWRWRAFRENFDKAEVLQRMLERLQSYIQQGQKSQPPSRETEPRAAPLSLRAPVSVPGPVPGVLLFGDLQAQTNLSLGKVDARSPDATCGQARSCAALDFLALADHAEHLGEADWKVLNESATRCSAKGPVVFAGWQWTQIVKRPERHDGSKIAIFAVEGRGRAPIGASDDVLGKAVLGDLRALAAVGGEFDEDALARAEAVARGQVEVAEDAGVLFEKLRSSGNEALVIAADPSWGLFSSPRASWSSQLSSGTHAPDLQRLATIYSRRGSSETYRSWRAHGADGTKRRSLDPRDDYLPCSFQAGVIVEGFCHQRGQKSCANEVSLVQDSFMDAGVHGWLMKPHDRPEQSPGWMDCGQCRDCYRPAFNHRPELSLQYALALGAHFGFVAGTGDLGDSIPLGERTLGSRKLQAHIHHRGTLQAWEWGRQRDYVYPGGLTAVHAHNPSREAIWEALRNRRVYSTTGPRIKLAVDLVNAPGDERLPMGSEAAMTQAPSFKVRAVGAPIVEPGGCHDPVAAARPIERIEVVRIRHQLSSDEDVAKLVDDPWRVFPCDGVEGNCSVQFMDEEYPRVRRTTFYYVRVVQGDDRAWSSPIRVSPP